MPCQVDLPRGRATPLQQASKVTLTVTRDGVILLNETEVTLESLPATLRPLIGNPDVRIIVNADSAAPNGTVVQAMLRAREAGAEHFLFAVKPE